MRATLRPLLVMFAVLMILTGVLYPLAVTAIGKLAFANQTSGSLIKRGDVIIGSSLIGQPFQDARYFWGRVSATSPMPNNAAASGGSNLGPTNPALMDAIKTRLAQLRAADPDNALPVPVDLVTASASGLDPQISPAAALYQLNRVARARHLDPFLVRRMVLQHVEGAQWGIFGEPRVNVLMLNLAMDRAQ